MKTKNPPVVLSKSTPHKSAEKFRELHRQTLINVEDEWFAYDPSGAYLLIPDDDIKAEVARFLISAKCVVMLKDAKTKETRKEHVPFDPKNADNAEVYEALKRYCHRSRPDRRQFWLDGRASPKPENIIACRNGLLDVETLEVIDHTPEFFTRHALPIRYDAEAGKPEVFTKYLKAAMSVPASEPGGEPIERPHLVRSILEMMGYLLTADTSHEIVFYLLGQSRGGKGTLIHVLAALLGSNLAAPSIGDFVGTFWAQPLQDKSVLIVTDMAISDPAKVKQAANHINMISGRDPVMIQRKYKDALQSVVLPGRVVEVGNNMPNFGEHAQALANRTHIYPFDRTFAGNEDTTLKARLVAPDELEKIFALALRGLRSLRKRGRFLEPKESKELKKRMLRMSNPLQSFVDEMCTLEVGATVRQGDLYREYRAWCEANGVKAPFSKGVFSTRLYEGLGGVRESRPREGGGEQVRHYAGIRLNASLTAPRDADFGPALAAIDEYVALGFDVAEAIENLRREAVGVAEQEFGPA